MWLYGGHFGSGPCVRRQCHLLSSLGTAAERGPAGDCPPSLLLPIGMGNQDRVEPRPRAGGRAQRSQRPLPRSTQAALQAWLGCAHLPYGRAGAGGCGTEMAQLSRGQWSMEDPSVPPHLQPGLHPEGLTSEQV